MLLQMLLERIIKSAFYWDSTTFCVGVSPTKSVPEYFGEVQVSGLALNEYGRDASEAMLKSRITEMAKGHRDQLVAAEHCGMISRRNLV